MSKIHKNAHSIPIVNGINLITTRLGQYIDYFLKPFVSETGAYLRDTKHIIQVLEALLCRSNSIMVTADVSSLYSGVTEGVASGAIALNLGPIAPSLLP